MALASTIICGDQTDRGAVSFSRCTLAPIVRIVLHFFDRSVLMIRDSARNRPAITATLIAVWLVAGFGWAADTQVHVGVEEHAEHGAYLVDLEGRSLYLFTSDEDGVSTCTEACAENWPPLVVDDGAPLAGERVDAELLDEIEREDGSRQVTYAGWPLYTFVQDEEPGQTSGQGRNDAWFLVNPAGEAIGHDAEDEEATTEEASTESDDGVDMEALMTRGEDVFANVCARCHGAQGGGGEGPRLVGHRRIDDTSHLISVVHSGIGYMPAVGRDLSDEEIAAVLTYVRNSWGNEAGPVTVEEVEAER
jgi:predicted lipoprotein with Yx(FWY)xxD motif/cytochrome c5